MNDKTSLLREDDEIQSLMYKWRSRTLYTGPAYSPRKRKHYSHSLLVDFNGPFEICDTNNNESTVTRMALVPIGTTFKMTHDRDIFTVIYLDQYGLDFKKISKGK